MLKISPIVQEDSIKLLFEKVGKSCIDAIIALARGKKNKDLSKLIKEWTNANSRKSQIYKCRKTLKKLLAKNSGLIELLATLYLLREQDEEDPSKDEDESSPDEADDTNIDQDTPNEPELDEPDDVNPDQNTPNEPN